VSDSTLSTFMHLTYLTAVGTFLLAAMALSVRSLRSAARGGSTLRKLAREELVWTLAPTLIVVGLSLAGEIPLGWGKVAAERTAGETRALRR
jgi:heme/copper-type cytochrome/quinol oxidase subunit 2